MKTDNQGNVWVCLGPQRPQQTYGAEFYGEVKETPPARESAYLGDAAYADTVHAGSAFDRIINEVKKRQARRLLAMLQEIGCDFRVEGETLWVGPKEKLSVDDRELIALLKGELMVMVSSEAAQRRFDSGALAATK